MTTWKIGPLLAVVALLCSLLATGQTHAASPQKTVRARYDGLVLTLRAHVTGDTVIAKATLKNNGPQAWQYRGGCAPPEVQIHATDVAGNPVYGYRPPRVQCTAITILTLAPGARLTVHAHFAIAATVHVRAMVPAAVANQVMFQTPAIVLAPATQH